MSLRDRKLDLNYRNRACALVIAPVPKGWATLRLVVHVGPGAFRSIYRFASWS